MDNYLDDDDKGIGGLRKQFKEQKKLLDQQQTMIAQLLAERNTSSVADTLASSGLDPRVAKFYPKDAPTDETSVAQWVEENKELFGNRRVVDNGTQNNDVLTDSERRGYQIIQDMAAYDTGLQTDLKSRLDKIQYDPQSPDKAQAELLGVLKEFEGYLNM